MTTKSDASKADTCKHNAMVANDDPKYAWKCADCGYIYGKPQWNEPWWQNTVKDFPGGLANAIWHMPDAAMRRMKWLEDQIK